MFQPKSRAWEHRKSFWERCLKLSDSLDLIQLRGYIFSMLFYRYISESICHWFNESAKSAGGDSYDYSQKKLEEDEKNYWQRYLVENKGFFLLPQQLFKNVHLKNYQSKALRQDLNVTISKLFADIENWGTSKNFQGLLTNVDWKSDKLGKPLEASDLIWKIMELIRSLRIDFVNFFSRNSATYRDNLGDFYEYLNQQFDSEEKTKNRELYIPGGVPHLIGKILTDEKTHIRGAYDPCCSLGSLILELPKVLSKDQVTNIVCQEKHLTTYNLCRMNMIFHNLNSHQFEIRNENSLDRPPNTEDKFFEVIVANLPISVKWRNTKKTDLEFLQDVRFSGLKDLPPENKTFLALIKHCTYFLDKAGKAVLICPESFLSDKDAEKIKHDLIDQNYIESIILLPPNLFPEVSSKSRKITRIILILKKSKQDDKILFVDSSKLLNLKDSTKSLTEASIEAIFKVYKQREEREFISKLLSHEELQALEYDLTKVELNDVVRREQEEIQQFKSMGPQSEEIVRKQNSHREDVNSVVSEILEELTDS